MFVISVPGEPVDVKLDEVKVKALSKVFKSGSKGWYLGGKYEIKGLRCQVSLSIVVIGSKPPAELIEVKDTEDLSPIPEPSQNGPPEPSKPKPSRKAKKYDSGF